MKIGLVTIAYNEERFISRFLRQVPPFVDQKVCLISSTPWQGKPEAPDETAGLAALNGGITALHDWPTEHEQRNDGQEYFKDYDWIITLDPDEFLTNDGWYDLAAFLETAPLDAYVCQGQKTYWKSGYVIEPPEDFKQIIAVRPSVNFFDKRCVDVPYGEAPVELHHFSWARTDAEVLKKISHYSHAHELNKDWYNDVWLKWTPSMKNLHPLTPSALLKAVKVKDLPEELEGLWP